MRPASVDGASPVGTEASARRAVAAGVQPSAYRPLGRTGLTASLLGFGCYRVGRQAAHRDALREALEHGCNVIDTSTNYGDGDSERCVGEVLHELMDRGALGRESVIVVSKAGYIQGENLGVVQSRARRGRPFPEVVEYAEGCWHCIHPDFLADQLGRSLERLGLARVDVYLLHNPEYFLLDARRRRPGTPLDPLREEFYGRVRRAFVQLEDEVAGGRLGWYGVSSNTFPSPADDGEATSATRMLAIARAIAAERHGDPEAHHLAVLQTPMNLYEGGAALTKNNGRRDELTVLQFAAQERLGVLINRPLNAFHHERLIRLADFAPPPVGENVTEAAARLARLEDDFAARIAPHIRVAAGGVPAADWFRWSGQLAGALDQLQGVPHWGEVEQHMVLPRLARAAEQLDRSLSGEAAADWRRWWEQYRVEMAGLLRAIGAECARKSQRTSAAVSDRLAPFLPSALRGESLSRRALAAVAYTAGVSCVLNGMRSRAYVEDSLGVLHLEPFAAAAELYAAFAG